MINLDLRQTSLKKSMNDFLPLVGGTHRNAGGMHGGTRMHGGTWVNA